MGTSLMENVSGKETQTGGMSQGGGARQGWLKRESYSLMHLRP